MKDKTQVTETTPRAPQSVPDGHPGHLVYCAQEACKRRFKRRRVPSLALAYCDSCGGEETLVVPAPKLQIHLQAAILEILRDRYGKELKPKKDSDASFVTALLMHLAR